MMSLGLQARALSIVKLLVYNSCTGKMVQANARLFGYAVGLPVEAKTRYLEKLHLLNSLDPLLIKSDKIVSVILRLLNLSLLQLHGGVS